MAPSSTALFQGQAPGQRLKTAAEVQATPPDQDTTRQQDDAFSMAQLWNGTGFIAQAAVVTFALSLSGRVLARPLTLFSWHPLAQVLGLVAVVQSILVLQPARAGGQRRVGRAVHAWLNLASLAAFTGGFAAIYLNKERGNAVHFATTHGAIGAALTVLLWGQHLVGLAVWAAPYGGGRARTLLLLTRAHRVAGYANLLLLLATFGTAAGTGFVRNALKVEPWVFYVPMALIAVGVLPRIRAHKLGLTRKKKENKA
ncbi:cytochrome b561 [Cordyceps javanica]|uniref:Cytochrome b561 n=1 Tax=Cordyceps javanica TaxID=43265 RepID=A0A545UP15_9HYPO|nr:cytochrome b561 [Cordyceps javanica]TQW02991.1 cytochrome b561 [Cordyceps javanica]